MKPLECKISFLRILLFISLMLPQLAQARCGSVDYSWGAEGLAEATSFVGTMMIYTIDILNAGACIMVVIFALQIYIKMNNHEGDVTKSIMMLVGACLFMIGAMIVMPAFFGYRDMTFVF